MSTEQSLDRIERLAAAAIDVPTLIVLHQMLNGTGGGRPKNLTLRIDNIITELSTSTASSLKSWNVQIAKANDVETIKNIISKISKARCAKTNLQQKAVVQASRWSAERKGGQLLSPGEAAAMAKTRSSRWRRLATMTAAEFQDFIASGASAIDVKPPVPAPRTEMKLSAWRKDKFGVLTRTITAVAADG